MALPVIDVGVPVQATLKKFEQVRFQTTILVDIQKLPFWNTSKWHSSPSAFSRTINNEVNASNCQFQEASIQTRPFLFFGFNLPHVIWPPFQAWKRTQLEFEHLFSTWLFFRPPHDPVKVNIGRGSWMATWQEFWRK